MMVLVGSRILNNWYTKRIITHRSMMKEMDFDFVWKLILTCSFLSVSICLSVKWIVEAYLDYIQVQTGLRILRKTEKDITDDPTSY